MAFLRHPKKRGLTGVKLLVSDKCLGLIENLAEFYGEARWERCVVHFYRNVWAVVPSSKVREVAAMLKAIHAQEDREAARQKADAVVVKLQQLKLAQAAQLVRDGVEDNPVVLRVPARILALLAHQQPAGADYAGDSASHPRGRGVPRRTIGAEAGGGPTAPHRRHEVGNSAILGHGATQGGMLHLFANTKCGKVQGRDGLLSRFVTRRFLNRDHVIAFGVAVREIRYLSLVLEVKLLRLVARVVASVPSSLHLRRISLDRLLPDTPKTVLRPSQAQ
jgi:Transposase, Mutator family